MKRVFVVKQPSTGQYRTGTGWSGKIEQAKVWYRKQDAGMSVRANHGRNPHLNADDDCEVVELHAIALAPEGCVHVALPIGHDVLADFLEHIGLLEQAMQLRTTPAVVQPTT